MKHRIQLLVLAVSVLAGGVLAGAEVGYGSAECNCTSTSNELTVCHSTTVTVSDSGEVSGGASSGGVSVGGKQGWSSQEETGLSTCTKTDVPSGKCVYYKYIFACTYEFYWLSWFNSKECEYVSAAMQERDPAPWECND